MNKIFAKFWREKNLLMRLKTYHEEAKNQEQNMQLQEIVKATSKCIDKVT